MVRSEESISSQEIIAEIKVIHSKIKTIVIDSGIQEQQFNFLIKNIEKTDIEYQETILKWLKEFVDNEYKAVEDTLKQFPVIWESYKTLGINHLPEQILLRKRQKTLRLSWFKRPRPKSKKGKKDALQNMSILQSEQESS